VNLYTFPNCVWNLNLQCVLQYLCIFYCMYYHVIMYLEISLWFMRVLRKHLDNKTVRSEASLANYSLVYIGLAYTFNLGHKSYFFCDSSSNLCNCVLLTPIPDSRDIPESSLLSCVKSEYLLGRQMSKFKWCGVTICTPRKVSNPHPLRTSRLSFCIILPCGFVSAITISQGGLGFLVTPLFLQKWDIRLCFK